MSFFSEPISSSSEETDEGLHFISETDVYILHLEKSSKNLGQVLQLMAELPGAASSSSKVQEAEGDRWTLSCLLIGEEVKM